MLDFVKLIASRLISCRIRIDLKNAYIYTNLEFGRSGIQTYKLYLSPALNQDDLEGFLLLFAFPHDLSFIL